MPRSARIKSPQSIFHVMVRSVGDIALYRDNKDKDRFVFLIKKYKTLFQFKVYAFCIMTNHSHILIDTNGADISDIMHGINQSYAQYYNRKYNRRGHLFQDRFKSKIINSDRYLLVCSAYIHNNPNDIKKYRNSVENYNYSSLGIYLGIRNDAFNIVDKDYIMKFYNSDLKKARDIYVKLVCASNEKSLKRAEEFENEKSEYRSERSVLCRKVSIEDILSFISNVTRMDKNRILLKNNHKNIESKALSVYFMRCMCGYTIKDVCRIIGNITESRISKLCSIGIDLIFSDKYKDLVEKFLTYKLS